MITAEQREARKGKIGGSDVATILGLNAKYETPHDFWLNITERLEVDDEDTDPTWWGTKIESLVVEKLVKQEREKEVGYIAEAFDSTLVHPDYPMFIGHIDGIRRDRPRGIEVKTTVVLNDESGAPIWGEPGTNQIPAGAHCQSQFYSGFPELDWLEGFDIPMFYFPRRSTTLYISDRDSDQIARMYDYLAEWYEKYVVGDTPPPAVNTDDLLKIFPNSGGQIIADNEIIQTVFDLKEVKSKIKGLEAEKGKAEFLIKDHMGEHAVLVDLEGKPLTTWKTTKSSRFNQKRFGEDHPALLKDYKDEGITRRFLVK